MIHSNTHNQNNVPRLPLAPAMAPALAAGLLDSVGS